MSNESQYEGEPRQHTEQPAEGKPSQDPADTGIHSQDPAEGADTESETSDDSGQD